MEFSSDSFSYSCPDIPSQPAENTNSHTIIIYTKTLETPLFVHTCVDPAVTRVTADHWTVRVVILVHLITDGTVTALPEVTGALHTQCVDKPALNVLSREVMEYSKIRNSSLR